MTRTAAPTSGQSGLAGCILAGGLARRMGGGDKPLLALDGRPLLAHVIDRLAPQVGPMVLNANGDAARFSSFALPVAADPVEGFAGPLAGVLAGLRWAQTNRPEVPGVVSVAGDTPFFPTDLVTRLISARGAQVDRIVLAKADGHLHPVFGYWPVALADALERFLREATTRKVLAFVDAHDNAIADFGASTGGGDPFFNINTPEELAEASARARSGGSQ